MPLPDWPEAPGPDVLTLECRDIKGMNWFYQVVLGYRVLKWGGQNYLVRGDDTVVLVGEGSIKIKIEGDVPEAEREEMGEVVFDRVVENIKEAYEHFRRCGVRFVKDWREGEMEFEVLDPDGTAWRVIQGDE